MAKPCPRFVITQVRGIRRSSKQAAVASKPSGRVANSDQLTQPIPSRSGPYSAAWLSLPATVLDHRSLGEPRESATTLAATSIASSALPTCLSNPASTIRDAGNQTECLPPNQASTMPCRDWRLSRSRKADLTIVEHSSLASRSGPPCDGRVHHRSRPSISWPKRTLS